MNRRLCLALLAVPLAASARAHSARLGDILIGHAWARPSVLSEAQAFVPLANNGAVADDLVAARSEICGSIELRRNNRYDDPPLLAFRLEPGRPLTMRPGARHLRLLGLKRPLKHGDRFPLVLDFLNAGEAMIEVIVEPAPDGPPPN